LREPRRALEKALGPGKSKSRGLVLYFGDRLLVDYWFHDRLTRRAEYLKTNWGGFHTRSGVHVGSSQRDLSRVGCIDRICTRPLFEGADAPATGYGIRKGKIAWIAVGYL
jgi:hypothetical protein